VAATKPAAKARPKAPVKKASVVKAKPPEAPLKAPGKRKAATKTKTAPVKAKAKPPEAPLKAPGKRKAAPKSKAQPKAKVTAKTKAKAKGRTPRA